MEHQATTIVTARLDNNPSDSRLQADLNVKFDRLPHMRFAANEEQLPLPSMKLTPTFDHLVVEAALRHCSNREYAEPPDAVILQYRDRHGPEVDLQEKSGARPCFRTHTITRYSSTPPRFR